MRFLQKLCPRCPDGLMRVQSGRRGYFYQCKNLDCRHTINQGREPEATTDPELEPVVTLPFPSVAS